MNLFHKLTNYYRQSLSDAVMKEVNQKELCEDCLIDINEILRGEINASVTEYIFRQKYNSRYREAIEMNWTVDVILCPFSFEVNSEHGNKKVLPETLVPIMMPAKLYISGKLSHTGKKPWIDRKLLSPTELEPYKIGSVQDLDNYLSTNSLDVKKHPSWPYYIDFVNEMLKTVCKMELNHLVIKDFSLTKDAFVVVNNIINASNHLRELYEYIVDKSIEPNSLARNMFNYHEKEQQEVCDEKNQFDLSGRHFGQMGCGFPLSSSQRETMNYYLSDENEEVFAVNGPPGTGKTTLLHSIIANEYVTRADKGQEPPIIFATSNNNQAVTNIIDSFTESDEDADLLSRRWLKGLFSLGAYLVSDKKKGVDAYQTIIETSRTDGYYKKLEKRDELEKLHETFMQMSRRYLERNDNVILSGVIEELKCRINKNVKKIRESIPLLIRKKNQIESLEKLYPEGFEIALNEINDELLKYEMEREEYVLISASFDNWYNNHFIIVKFFIKMNLLKFLYKRSMMDFVNKHLRYFSTKDHGSFTRIEQSIIDWNSELSQKELELQKRVRKIESDRRVYIETVQSVETIACEFGCDKEYSDDIYNEINNAMDTGIRYESFMLSVHYYEGRWLLECFDRIKKNETDKKSEISKRKFWYRMAKLTPCFVSTFYMIPKFLQNGEFGNNDQWVKNYFLNFIDILIIDEAGQASPEVCLPLSMLAKKAIFVGDVYQIEPVWSVERYSDIPNIKAYIGEEYISSLIESGYSAHSGNLMTIAKRHSNFQKFSEGGMYLTEHRRCLPDIIQYCNELTYENKLIPMRRNDREGFILPNMLHIDCKGNSTKKGGSRKNEFEAEAIARWIANNSSKFVEYYNALEKEDKSEVLISDIIAVVTPFKAQANLIRNLLRRSGFGSITVGTVHSLQGAERRIVVFSTVYDSKDGNSYFFDSGVNMLNVAVSRAKDSFVVFGDSDILKPGNTKPSEILAKYLTFTSQSI